MPKYSEIEKSTEVEALFAAARKKEITVSDFRQSLSDHGVSALLSVFYIRDAFGISLEQAKALVAASDVEASETCASGISQAIEEIQTMQAELLQ